MLFLSVSHTRSRDNEVSLLSQQVSQLKKYIGESEQARSVELWKQELEAVRAKNKVNPYLVPLANLL